MPQVEELFARALTAHEAGELDVAEPAYRQILALDPSHVGTLTNLGSLLVRRGQFDEAARLYQAAVAANPDYAAGHFNLGNLYRQSGRLADAVTAFSRAVRLAPDFAAAHVNLGLVVRDSGNWPAAVEHFRQAVEIDPNVREGLNLLGDALVRVGRTDEAINALREWVNRSPDDPRSHHALGLTLLGTGKPAEAIPELELALRLWPDYPAAHNALGVARVETGQPDQGYAHFREATRLDPKLADAWSNLGISLRDQGLNGAAAEAMDRALELRPDPAIASHRLLAAVAASEISPEQLRIAHEAWASKYAAVPVTGGSRTPDPGRPLKIGYVFGEIPNRATAAFLEALLTYHDRSRVHVTCYPNTTRDGDALVLLRGRADGWQSLVGVPDRASIDLIRTAGIDVLVDLSGHQVGNRLPLFAHKLAPRQVSLFGYPAPTGLRAIDFRISDGIADPPATGDRSGPEKVLRLPDVGRLYVPPSSAPTPAPVADRPFVFGCLNHPAKISNLCLETWVRLLKAVPQSMFVVQVGFSVEAVRDLTQRFTRSGLSSDRLVLTYRMPEPEYLAAYQAIDLALDPFPFSGRTTTCDALWMGVPVLTVAGADCRSRQGASILNSIGLPDFVADSPDRLIDLAATWAGQREALTDLRETLREMMAQSPLTDAKTYVRNLEEAYRTTAL